MNEKLGKEIERKWKFETHMCKQSDFIGVFFLQKDYEDFARYFYNLALADVKREIAGRKGVNEHLGRKGHIEEDLLILEFIDEQSK